MSAGSMLTLVEAAIEALLSDRPVERYSIAGISVEYSNLTELMNLRERLRREIAARNRNPIQLGDLRGR